MKVITNYNWREFRYGNEVPESVHADYEHLEESEHYDMWIWYRSRWYHISDFLAWNTPWTGPKPADLAYWDGMVTDTFFSGVVIKVSEDCEKYQIGLCLC